MAVIHCPEITQELINYLDHVFPDEAVNPKQHDPSITFGQVQVVRHLKAVKQTQEEDIYVST